MSLDQSTVTAGSGEPNLSGSFTDPQFNIAHVVTIDWGDETAGSPPDTTTIDLDPGETTFQAEPNSTTYAAAGTYPISVTVTGVDGTTTAANFGQGYARAGGGDGRRVTSSTSATGSVGISARDGPLQDALNPCTARWRRPACWGMRSEGVESHATLASPRSSVRQADRGRIRGWGALPNPSSLSSWRSWRGCVKRTRDSRYMLPCIMPTHEHPLTIT